MSNRPATVTAISWLAMLFAMTVVSTFLVRVATFESYEITSISLVVWWFVVGLFPLYFLSGLFMLYGRSWAREVCVAGGISAVLFGLVILPFTQLLAGEAIFVIVATIVLYRPKANSFFARPHGKSRRLGLCSFWVGAIAVGLTVSAVYIRSTPDPRSDASLNWLTKMGLVKQAAEGERSFTTTSIFVVNDENALIFLTCLAVGLACVAMVLAVVAEYRREPTLYLSAGYTCGALALYQYRPALGFVSMIAGIAVSLVLRHDRRRSEDT